MVSWLVQLPSLTMVSKFKFSVAQFQGKTMQIGGLGRVCASMGKYIQG